MKKGLTSEQLAERLKYITATDMAVICRLSPWKNPVELWLEKTEQSQAKDISNSPAVVAGHYLEPVIAQWFSDETGKKLRTDESLKPHKTIPYIAAHIDRLVEGEPAALECKSTISQKGWGERGENIIPDYYLVQCAHEAMAWDLERVYCAVLISGNDFRHYVYERNDKLEQALIERCATFWGHVQNMTPPTPVTGDEVLSLHGTHTTSEPALISHDVNAALDEIREIRARIKELNTRQAICEDIVKAHMGTADTLLGFAGDVQVTWKKARAAKRLDAKRLKAEAPEIYEKYLSETKSSRRFLVK